MEAKAAPAKEGEPESKGGGNVFGKLFGWMVRPEKDPKKESNERRERPTFGDLVGVQGGMTALLLAARQGHLETVAALLDRGPTSTR